jgi:hypothetical protein
MRIVRRPLIVVDPDGAVGELDRVGLAQQNHSGGGQLAHDRAVLSGDVIRQQTRAGGGRHPLHVEKILRGVGDAVQEAQLGAALQGALGRVRLRQSPLGHDRMKALPSSGDPGRMPGTRHRRPRGIRPDKPVTDLKRVDRLRCPPEADP